MSLSRWLALGSVSAAVIAALVFSLGPSSSDLDDASASSATAAEQSARGGVSRPTVVLPGRDPVASASVGDAGTTTTSSQRATGDSATDADTTVGSGPAGFSGDSSPIPAPFVSTGIRLRVPTLEVDAAVTPLGFDGAGGYSVPNTAAGVGWYEFSAQPGAAGNTVLGGHLNWRGSRGVFDRLDELSPGDMIYVDTVSGEVAYRVVGSRSVTSQTPFVDILGKRAGPSTLTLFTCGGTFSSAAGEYDERLVVTAVRA